MKKEILKIAGVKSEKEFYKKFPTEEAFMKAHGKAFKKAQIGAYIGGEQDPGFQPLAFQDVYDEADYAITGMTDEMRREEARRNAEATAAQKQASGGGGGLGNIAGALTQMGEMFGEEGAAALAGAKKGKDIPKAQRGPTGTGGIGYPSGPQLNLPTTPQSQFMWNYTPNPNAPNNTWATNNPSLNITTKQGGDEFTKAVGKYAGPAGQIVQGIQQLRDEKRALQRAEQAQAVSDISLQAARTRPEETQRRYVRPEDVVNTGEEFFPIYGVGTNVLARDGKMVGGIPGEIANTFAPNTLYDDLGYEPLNDSERYKQFYYGGEMRRAQGGDWLSGTGFYNFASSGGADATGQLITGITGENAGGNIGGAIGGTIGSAFGPAGKMVGQAAGQLIGSAINRRPQKIKRAQRATQQNIQNMALQQGLPGVQAQYTSFMKDGGEVGNEYKWVSHTWQPQKIVSFGGHNLKDLLKPPHDADMLRAGGHLKAYTPPSERAMSTERPDMEEGGELQIHWGGGAEPMSYNPHLPDGGETIMFRGKSHDDGGIGITYGDNPVEVERGEPALKLQDGGAPGDSSLVVFGNLKIPKSYIPFLGKEAEGKKFKTYVADLSNKENKQNKIIDKAANMLSDFDPRTSIDKITLNSLQYNMLGANSKLKELAEKKMTAASLQNAINDTAEEMGLVADDLARGRVKIDKEAMKEYARFGKMIKAQAGTTTPPVSTQERVNEIMRLYELAKAENAKAPGKKNKFALELQKKYHEYFPEIAQKIILESPSVTSKAKSKGIKNVGDLKSRSREEILDTNVDSYFGPRTEQYVAALPKPTTPEEVTSIPPKDVIVPIEPRTTTDTTTVATRIPVTPYKRDPYLDALGQALPFVRPTDQEQLDPTQIMGEMYALATNQLEPVQAQTMQPLLTVPYDISLQDQLNENEATFRSQQRLLGYNPSFQAALNAQKYMANQRPLAEQFRMNQAMRDAVYRDNRNILNQFGLQNLAILDKQYERQTMAKSLTKATTQAALNSISDKFMRNQLENRTLATMENLYNYRYDPRFRTINMNAPYQPQMPTVYIGPDGKKYNSIPVLDTQGNVVAYQQQPTSTAQETAPMASPATPVPTIPLPSQMKEQPGPFEQTGRTGKNVNKKKGVNSSILKAFKNL